MAVINTIDALPIARDDTFVFPVQVCDANICDAYVCDANKIHDTDLKFFKNLEYFVIDCLRIKKHPSHYNLSEVIELTKIIKAKKTILTNLNADLDYNYLLKNLPKNIVPAYDGMSFFI